jgi:hypothetical protein
MDPDRFDLIDLDAYGWPCEQFRLVAEAGFHGPVTFTVLSNNMAHPPGLALAAVGLPIEWTNVAHMVCVLACRDVAAVWGAFIATLGATEMTVRRVTRHNVAGVYGHTTLHPAHGC